MNNNAEQRLYWTSQGKVATYDKWGGPICKVLSQIFSGFDIPKIIKIT